MKKHLYAVLWLVTISTLGLAACTPAPTTPGVKQWSAAPEMKIDQSKAYTATLHMAQGDIVIELLPKAAPITVNNFVFLAQQGFYNGVTFHRVLSGFMAQGGDPTGTGMGGPGYFIPNETSPDLTFDGPGVVAMANSGKDRNGSQFFITFGEQHGLDGGYTIFGRVIKGIEVVQKITLRDPQQNPKTPGDVITSVTIEVK
jgi:peptidylprolyl isomerase